MKKMNTQSMVKIAMFATISVVLYLFEFYIIPGSPLQFDLSDLPVIIAGYLLGAGPGFFVALLKNIIHAIFLSKNPGFVGELVNLVYATLIMLPFAMIKPTKKINLLGLGIISVVASALIMNVFNYYVSFPLYGLSKQGAWAMLFTVFFPFNIVKGTLLTVLFIVLMPYLNRIKSA